MLPLAMKKSSSLLLLLLLCAGLLHAQQHTLLIIADDVSPDYFGAFSPATDTAKAPNIRALADRGVRFTQTWAAPVCSPTRAGLFTGRYSFRTGVGQVITNATTPQLDTGEVSIAELLHDLAPQKYRTACVGKWHLHINVPGKRLNPNRMGFDFYSGNFNGAISNYFNYPIIVNGQMDTATTYATTQTVNDAIAWMDTVNLNRPFFLWVAFNAPHSPFHLPPANLCDTTGLPGTTAHINANPKKYFKAAIQAMDTEIGRLLQYLQTRNLLDSTNIIFMGDNGNETETAQIANPNKAKATLYDYGVHVPLLVAGPAVVNPNRSSDALVNSHDLFATMAELCGFSAWRNAIPVDTVTDSRSLLPILKNTASSVRTWIFTEQFRNASTNIDGKTIRNDTFHLIRFDLGNEAFYNVVLDPEENNNLLSGTLSANELLQYHSLCDTLTALTGSGSCSPLAIIEGEKAGRPVLHPNPASDVLVLQHADLVTEAILYDALGRPLLHWTDPQRPLPASGLPSGWYVLRADLRSGETMLERVLIGR